MNRKLLVLALAVAALALGACGDDEEQSASDAPAAQSTTEASPNPTDSDDAGGADGGGTELRADADPSGELKFTTESLEAPAGPVTITMDNPSELPHAVAVEGNGVDEEGDTVQKDGTSTVTVELKPGEYEFYCPVPGHEEGGMKGTLTVK